MSALGRQASTDESAFTVSKGLSREEAQAIVPRSRVKRLSEKWGGAVPKSSSQQQLVKKTEAVKVDLTGPTDAVKVDLTDKPRDRQPKMEVVSPDEDVSYGCFCFFE